MIRVVLPAQLCELAKVEGEVTLPDCDVHTFEGALDALEKSYPALRGTIRDNVTGKRRPMIRLFACEEDYSHLSLDTELPAEIIAGKAPLIVVGAIAGG